MLGAVLSIETAAGVFIASGEESEFDVAVASARLQFEDARSEKVWIEDGSMPIREAIATAVTARRGKYELGVAWPIAVASCADLK